MLDEQKFFQVWIRSLITHIIIFLVLFLMTKFNFFSTSNLEPRKIFSSVRVDILDLPKETLQELKKMEIKPPAVNDSTSKSDELKDKKLETKEKPKDVFEDIIKKTEKNVADKTIESLKAKNEKRQQDLRREEMNKLLLSGNKIQEGNRLHGEETQNKLTPFEEYIVQATEKVRLYWKLPSYLQGAELRCRIQLYLNAQGEILLLKIIQSSGNVEYDNWAEKSIREAVPFSPPDNSIRAELMRGNFILGFPL